MMIDDDGYRTAPLDYDTVSISKDKWDAYVLKCVQELSYQNIEFTNQILDLKKHLMYISVIGTVITGFFVVAIFNV